VQPGVTNLRISQHVAPLGLYYAPDPSSQIAVLDRRQRGREFRRRALPQVRPHGAQHRARARDDDRGRQIDLGSEALDAPGYDLLALDDRLRGLLAIILEVTVKLLPKPEAAQVVMASFADVESAGEAVAQVIGAGIVPAGLEMMDKLATEAVEEFVHAGYDLEAAAILLAESDGTREEVADEVSAHERGDARERRDRHPRLASEAERLRFWSGRKAAFPAVGRISPDYYCIDGSIPRAALGSVLTQHRARSRASTRCAAPTSSTRATATCIR
jgi:glycolate oxidase